jgi:D-alanyl-D-alanine carboxypeptidase
VTADGFLVYDVSSGSILAEKNGTEKFYVASLTKLMTALVSYDETDLNQRYIIAPDDSLDVSPELKLKQGDKVLAWDLFNAMLVGSANDAAKALAHFAADFIGKDFVDLMNQKAQELGMADSHFSNPMGFDSKYNYSTAEDLKKLVDKTQSLPAFTELGKKTVYKFTSEFGNSYGVTATNKLISSDSEVQAIKTGSTPNAKEAMITKITRNNHSVIVIVLSSQDREGDTLKLSDEVFKAYEWQE